MAQSAALAAWLRDAGVERSYASLDAFAKRVGLPRQAVVGWVQGYCSPYLRHAVVMARGLGISVDAVARACGLAAERRAERLRSERARRDALSS